MNRLSWRLLTSLSAVSVVLVSQVTGYGQGNAPKPVSAGSAKERELIRKQQQALRAGSAAPGELSVTNLKVGAKGRPANIDAKVVQMTDGRTMIVGLEDSRTANGRHAVWVILKAPTAGIVDGEFWRGGGWKDVTGHEILAVTGTTTYGTAGGGTRTVFVLEGATSDESPVGGAGKYGAAAYDDFIDPVRELLVKDWQREVDAIKAAIKGDEERLRLAKTPKERQHFESLIQDYKERLAKVERNDPPYIRLDALNKQK